MESIFGGGYLSELLSKQVEKYASEPLDKTLEASFYFALSKALLRATSQIPDVTPTKMVSVEGRAGILPPPARKRFIQDAMSGQASAPLKVSDEIVELERAEKDVPPISMHVILENNSTTAADSREIKTAIQTLRVLETCLKRGVGKLNWSSPDVPSLKLNGLQVITHLLTRRAFGEYSYRAFSVKDSQDIQGMIGEYLSSLKDTTSFRPDLIPSTDLTSHALIEADILRLITEDYNRGNVVIPVNISPKIYMERRPKLIKGYKDLTTTRPFPRYKDTNQTLILVEKETATFGWYDDRGDFKIIN